ncbi:MAG: hypothetical protein ACOCVI_03735 [Planctomycetota bacterium]
MPSRVPRTEYSAGGHWDLIREVTGQQVSARSGTANTPVENALYYNEVYEELSRR